MDNNLKKFIKRVNLYKNINNLKDQVPINLFVEHRRLLNSLTKNEYINWLFTLSNEKQQLIELCYKDGPVLYWQTYKLDNYLECVAILNYYRIIDIEDYNNLIGFINQKDLILPNQTYTDLDFNLIKDSLEETIQELEENYSRY